MMLLLFVNTVICGSSVFVEMNKILYFRRMTEYYLANSSDQAEDLYMLMKIEIYLSFG